MDNLTLPHMTPSHNSILQEATALAHATIQPILSSAEQRKAALVDVGLHALIHGHWPVVDAVTITLRVEGISHA